MKRLLMGFATCALIMASCSQQEIMENVSDGQGSLSFAAGVGKQSATRAAEFNNTALQNAATAGKGIVLHAYQKPTAWKTWYKDSVIYDNQWKLENSVRFRNESETKYITYFSTSGKLKEVMDATSPEKTTFETADFDSKFPAFTYEVEINSALQEDLIAGITEVAANKTDIVLGMRHILSQVNFGTVGYPGAKIQIQNILITKIKSKAQFTYFAANTYPIGKWKDRNTDATYPYYKHTNVAGTPDNTHNLVPETADRGDKYIFGDGGNAGPGKVDTWYPTSEVNKPWTEITTNKTDLKNSLMLLPQTLTDAKVTFEYKIQDEDDAYVAGGPDDVTWAKGEFSLDFDKHTVDDKYYKGEWEQNYRYVYLIDFTNFLDGISLTFDVNVEMYPWENHDGGDGIINIMAAGQPTAANMNNIANASTWHIASQSITAPNTYTPKMWAQVMRDETWNLSTYNFAKIDAGQTFILSFENVIFNTKKDDPNPNVATEITLTLPKGYSVTNNTAGITMANGANDTYTLSKGNKSDNATITIKNEINYNSSTSLTAGIVAITANAQTIYYKGTEAVDLTTMDNSKLITDGNTITVKFTSSIIPTVGATDNGIWTWDATTRIATWTKVTWIPTLEAVKTAVANAEASKSIYCSFATDIASLSTAFGEPANSPVYVVFKKAAKRTPDAATAAGAWTYDAAAKTATWTKNP